MTRGSVPRRARVSSPPYLSADMMNSNGPKPLLRRPCPSAQQHRCWGPVPLTCVASSSNPVTSTELGQPAVTPTLSDPTAMMHEPRRGRIPPSSISSSVAVADGCTDAAGHARTLIDATSAGGGATNKVSEVLPAFTAGVTGGPRTATAQSCSHAPCSERHEAAQRENGLLQLESVSPGEDLAEARTNTASRQYSSSRACGSVIGGQETHGSACACESVAGGGAQNCHDCALPTPNTLYTTSQTAAAKSAPAQSPTVHLAAGVALVATEAAPHQQARTRHISPVRCLTHSEPSVLPRAALQHLHSPAGCNTRAASPSSQLVVSSSNPLSDWKPIIVSHSCSLTQLMQRHQQEGWRDELRSSLKQDVDVWVQQVCEEQQLLQAQLAFTQAKVAELTREVQLLRVDEVKQRPPSPFTVGMPLQVKPEEAVSPKEEYGGANSLCTSHAGAGYKPDTDTEGHDVASDGLTSPAYVLEMETYIHSLEAHTRALHYEKAQLQLRLDRRTLQLASAQRRYQQNYALLLREQAILETDYQKAREDVEEVAGMMVVARAAEQAALRRLNEYELALEEAELNKETTAAHGQPPLQTSDEEASAAALRIAAVQSPLAPLEEGNAGELAQQASAYSSPYYFSCVEANGPDGATVSLNQSTISSIPQSPPSERPAALRLPVPPRSAFDKAVFSAPASPTHRTPLLPLSPSSRPIPPTSPPTRGEAGFYSPETLPPPSGLRSSMKGKDDDGAGLQRRSSSAFVVLSRDDGSATFAPTSPGESVALPLPVAVTPLPVAVTPPPVPAEESCGSHITETASSAPRSSAQSGGRLLTPIAPPLLALLTPRSLAAKRTTAALAPGCDSGSPVKGAHCQPGEHELLRFKCTLLELELQSKEKLHKEEKERWENAVFSAEGVRTVVGEVEARVRQVHAASNKVKGLLHEMNRLWCNSLALEDECESDEDVGVTTRGRSPVGMLDEERPLSRQSLRTSSSSSSARHQGSVERTDGRENQRSQDSRSSGREFFGIEGRFVY